MPSATPEPVAVPSLSLPQGAEEKFREFLQIRGEKLTAARRTLVAQIFANHKHFDADELISDLQASGQRVSRATVYRSLRLLVEAGILRELRLTNRTVYEHDHGYPSHDHMHCTSCGSILEFTNEEISLLSERLATLHGFRASGHRFVISGECGKCLRARSPRRRLDLI